MNDYFHVALENSKKLFRFLESGNTRAFIRFLKGASEETVNLNLPNNSGTYLIFYAVIANNVQAVGQLINKKCRLDLVDNDDRYLLYYPIRYGYDKLLQMLLGYNNTKVGLSIIHLRDKSGNMPLYYAIRYHNLFAVQQLLFYGADPNDVNKGGLNALHLSIIYKATDVFALLLPKIRNIDAQTKKGYTCLHYAANVGSVSIVQKLLSCHSSPNIVDYVDQYSPIFFAVIQNNLPVVQLLVPHSLPNIQDRRGYTILHHSISDKNVDLTALICHSYPMCKNEKNYSENLHGDGEGYCLQLNLANISGDIPLGLMLSHYSLYTSLVDTLVVHSNLNLQNNKGYTSLHIIAQNNLWMPLAHLLQTKKLNIYVKTNNNKTVLEMIDPQQSASFLNIVYDSYWNRLLRGKGTWLEDWQNNCDRQKEKCYNHIKRTIARGNSSFPVVGDKKRIVVTDNYPVYFPTFTGSPLDILVGFKNITKHYPLTTIAVHNTQSIPPSLERYCRNLGIIQNNHQNLIYFDLFWVYQKLFLPNNLTENLNHIMSNDTYQYVIFHLAIILPLGHHSNGLFYNKQTSTLERFEPHGSSYPDDFNYNPALLDQMLVELFSTFDNNLKYLHPSAYLPKIGFQAFESTETSFNKNIGDPNGYCALWVIWYLHYRLKYVHLPARKVTRYLINAIRLNNNSFRSTIRNYSATITKSRDTYLEGLNSHINDYLNNRLSIHQLTLLRDRILNDSY